jgi:hypothetical protein
MLILTALAALTIGVIGYNAYVTVIRDLDRALASLRANPVDEPAVPNPNQDLHP